MFDTSNLGDWGELPFFKTKLPQIEKALTGSTVYPPPALTFRALERCQPQDARVVILGQDPYHTEGKADGFAFSIPQGFGGRLDSLGNIFKEMESDLNAKRSKTSLDDWADHGVLLLNTALTVPPGQANGHAKFGWDMLVRDVFAKLNTAPRAFILWGGKAKPYAKHLNGPHLIHTSAHPSPLSAHNGFFGSRPFSTVNQWLIEQDQQPIHWADPV